MHQLCGDESLSYFEAWENGYGPGQKAKGLGDRVAKAINTVTGGRVKPCGGCGQRRKWLNSLTDAPENAPGGIGGSGSTDAEFDA